MEERIILYIFFIVIRWNSDLHGKGAKDRQLLQAAGRVVTECEAPCGGREAQSAWGRISNTGFVVWNETNQNTQEDKNERFFNKIKYGLDKTMCKFPANVAFDKATNRQTEIKHEMW